VLALKVNRSLVEGSVYIVKFFVFYHLGTSDTMSVPTSQYNAERDNAVHVIDFITLVP
jgi:hypothetical protein